MESSISKSYLPVIGDTSQGVVPGHEGSEQSEPTTSLDDIGVWSSIGGLEVTNTEEEEGQIQEEEEEEECDSRAERANEQDEGKDEPAHQEQTERIGEVVDASSITSVGSLDVEATRSQNNGESNPETTVGGESSGTKSVSNSHFPRKLSDILVSRMTSFRPIRILLARAIRKKHVRDVKHTTCQRAIERDHHNRKQGRPQC